MPLLAAVNMTSATLPPAPFRYRDWGTLATMGRTSAVADFGRFRVRGLAAWVIWVFVHIWYLINFRSRVRVLINWIWQYVRFSPGARLILGNPVEGKDPCG